MEVGASYQDRLLNGPCNKYSSAVTSPDPTNHEILLILYAIKAALVTYGNLFNFNNLNCICTSEIEINCIIGI